MVHASIDIVTVCSKVFVFAVKAFPNRMIYSEFKQRYSILAPNAIPERIRRREKSHGKHRQRYSIVRRIVPIGHHESFLQGRNVLGQLEDLRDQALSKIIATLQAQIRGYNDAQSLQENVGSTCCSAVFSTQHSQIFVVAQLAMVETCTRKSNHCYLWHVKKKK